MDNRYIVNVQEDEFGEQFIEFPQEIIESTGWKEGDTLNWDENTDGSFTLTKVRSAIDTEWVLVECVSSFKIRYMVEVPKGKKEYALDTVSCDDAIEFSQEYLGEHIMSHRVVSKEEAISLSDVDNSYASKWSDNKKMSTFFTPWDNTTN